MPVSGKCYSLRRGELHTAVAYPDLAEDYTREQVEEALRKVGLEHTIRKLINTLGLI